MKKTALLLGLLLMNFWGFGQGEFNIQMVFVKGGQFYMGCDDPKFMDPEYDNEKPVHRVSVTDFYLAKYEVTLGTYRKLMGKFPPAYDGVDYGNKFCDECPIVMMSWEDAQAFIKRLNEKTGKNYRLPTETEWEYAARGGKYTEGYKFAGSNRPGPVAWWGKIRGTTHPVGEKLPNELGIFDMSGNVAEWCADWYGADYYAGTVDQTNPKGPSTGKLRVVRGGSYYDPEEMCRTVYRNRLAPATRRWDLGFRLAMDAPSGATAPQGKDGK
jgi:formylglycine-generating enzyme required for sulfatase activity